MIRTNDPTYTDLVNLRDRLDRQQSQLQSDLEEVRKKLESVSMTLTMLDAGDVEAVLASPHHGKAVAIDVASLRGMKQLDALRKIAQQGGGTLQTTTAKRLLLQAGLIKNPKNANNILFSVINRSGLFERVEPGVYRLKVEKPVRPEKDEFSF